MYISLADSGNLYSAAHSAVLEVAGIPHHQAHLTASLPADALALDPHVMSVAKEGLTELAASANSMLEQASTASNEFLSGQPSLQALSVLAAERLALLQSIDPVAHQTMQSSMDTLIGALNDLVNQEVGYHAQSWTNALVLGVQQLVAATRLQEAGGAYGINGMAEAQQAFQSIGKVCVRV
jgi:hypothetical protein